MANDNPQASPNAPALAAAAKRSEATAPVSGTDTVTVGCKLPHGLHLDIVQIGEPVARHTVKGANSSALIGGFGITEGVPRAFWDRWMKQSKDLAMVKNGLVFAMESTASARDKAADGAAASGFERLDPNKMPANLEKAENVAA